MPENKNFLTYNQQMKKLRNDKKIDCKDSPHKNILVRAGYFNIINGYKTPFICDEDLNGNHIYLPNTSIEQLYVVKKFDDDLRLFLLKYITQVEEEVRTLTGYKFDQCNGEGKIPWYDTNAYSERASLQNKMNAISSAYNELSKSQLDYVKFYMQNHKQIPTWIMIKVVNFSTFISVLSCSKKSVTHSICKLYGMFDSKELPNIKLLIGSLHWLRKVRNSCAHNERIYCIHQADSNNKRKNGRIIETYINSLQKTYLKNDEKRIFDLLIYFKYYLPQNEFEMMINELYDMLKQLSDSITENAFDNIRGAMGIKDLEDLLKLQRLPKKKIDYNKFDKL
ncbi:MAG: Abi family protein [Eubacterium sp.]|nr:Abi family protein [Eubacterium sp.]